MVHDKPMIKHFLCHLNQDKVSQFADDVMNEPDALASTALLAAWWKAGVQTRHVKLPGQSSAE